MGARMGTTMEFDPDTLKTELPQQLQQARRWLLWKAVTNGDQKPKKIPYYANGKMRNGKLDAPEDVAQLADLDTVLAAMESGKWTGLGFALGPDGDGYWHGVDFDSAAQHPHFETLIESAPGYIERSPSGNGYHVLGYGRHFPSLASNASGIEAYAQGRYFTVTGDAVGGGIADLRDFVDRIETHHRVAEAPRPPGSGEDPPIVAHGRNVALSSLAGTMRHRGMSAEGILAGLRAENEARCRPPLEDREIVTIARSYGRYAPGEMPGGEANPQERLEPPLAEDLVISEAELAAAHLTPRCIVRDHTFADVAQVIAPGGTGKTTMLIHESVHIALGRPVWGLPVESPGWTLFVTAEDRRERLVARLREILRHIPLTMDERKTALRGLRIWDVSGMGAKLVVARDGNVVLTALADQVVKAYAADPPVVIIFDPMVSFGASEQMVNDNEQAIITAARRMVNGLNCCVRIIHHTGKANAREATLDQYSGRGGSAMADGSRMTTVLGVPGDKLIPPHGCVGGPGVSLTVMNRAKLSYSPPGLPLLWIRREGFAYEAFPELPPVTPEVRRQEQADQVARFLMAEFDLGRLYSARDLYEVRETLEMPRDAITRAISELRVSGRLVDEPLPSGQCHGGKKSYLAILNCAK